MSTTLNHRQALLIKEHQPTAGLLLLGTRLHSQVARQAATARAA